MYKEKTEEMTDEFDEELGSSEEEGTEEEHEEGSEEHEGTEEVEEELEEMARKAGWKPKEEWDGKGEWRDAKEFLEKGKEINSFLKKQNDSLLSELRAVKDENKKVLSATERIIKMHEESKKQAVEEALRQFERQRQEAIEEGDYEAVVDIEKEMEKVKPKEEEKKDEGPPPNFQEWVRDNSWYMNDKKMAARADRIAAEFHQTGRFGEDDPDLYALVREEMEARYPSFFSNPNREKKAKVAASKRTPAGGKKSFNSLTKEQKDAYFIMKDHGLEISKEKWAEKFNEEE